MRRAGRAGRPCCPPVHVRRTRIRIWRAWFGLTRGVGKSDVCASRHLACGTRRRRFCGNLDPDDLGSGVRCGPGACMQVLRSTRPELAPLEMPARFPPRHCLFQDACRRAQGPSGCLQANSGSTRPKPVNGWRRGCWTWCRRWTSGRQTKVEISEERNWLRWLIAHNIRHVRLQVGITRSSIYLPPAKIAQRTSTPAWTFGPARLDS